MLYVGVALGLLLSVPLIHRGWTKKWTDGVWGKLAASLATLVFSTYIFGLVLTLFVQEVFAAAVKQDDEALVHFDQQGRVDRVAISPQEMLWKKGIARVPRSYEASLSRKTVLTKAGQSRQLFCSVKVEIVDFPQYFRSVPAPKIRTAGMITTEVQESFSRALFRQTKTFWNDLIYDCDIASLWPDKPEAAKEIATRYNIRPDVVSALPDAGMRLTIVTEWTD